MEKAVELLDIASENTAQWRNGYQKAGGMPPAF
jgi:hypothetical protein